jgi:polyisoprenoid-binding protein YceI
MKISVYPLAILVILILSAFTALQTTKWKIAEGYSIKFSSKDPSGVFKDFKGEIIFDEKNLDASKFNVVIDVNSISTGNGIKNKQAKSDKWFDAKKYPEIRFSSTRISKTGTGYSVTGMLDLRGVQKEISFPFTFINNTFSGSFKIKRLDYNIGTTKGMAGKAALELQVDISVPVTK